MKKEEKKKRMKIMMNLTDCKTFSELIVAVKRYERKEKLKKLYEENNNVNADGSTFK